MFRTRWWARGLALIGCLALAACAPGIGWAQQKGASGQAGGGQTGKAGGASASDYLSKGVEFTNKGDYEKAVAEFTQAIQLDPTSRAFRERGTAYLRLNNNDKALADLNEAIRLD